MKKLILRGMSVGVGLLLSVLIIEILLRLWTPDVLTFKSVRSSDPVRHHKLESSKEYIARTKEFTNRIKTNSLGLRDEELTEHTTDNRILMLGDSFVEGIGVEREEGLPSQLENRLNSLGAPHPLYRVINFGVAGYSPILEYVFLRDAGLQLRPRLVILCYDMTDVQEDFAYAEDADFDSLGVPIRVHPSLPSFGGKTRFPRSRLKTMIQENSYLYSLVVEAFRNPEKRRVEIRPGDITSGRYAHTVDSTDEKWRTYFERSQFYVKLVADLCRKNDIIFVLTAHPRGHQVNSLEWIEGRKQEGIGDGTYNSAVFASLRSLAERENILFLDMTDAFKSRSRGNLYYPLDGHWTPKGHVVAADTLFQFLRETVLRNPAL